MSTTIIRRAETEDAEAMYSIKQQLPIQLDGDTTSKGGFLLGTTVQQYIRYIEEAYCLVAEKNNSVIGFGIVLPDAQLRSSDVWLRRNEVSWKVDIGWYEQQGLCYFEQLAVLPGNRRVAMKLAYQLVRQAFAEGANVLFTTTVNKPVKNLAAIPFIYAARGIHAGNIDEQYPIVGHINSDIYIIEREVLNSCLVGHPLYSFFTADTL